MTLKSFVNANRIKFKVSEGAVRDVFLSGLSQQNGDHNISDYIADRAPLFYRDIQNILTSLKSGLFLTAFKETLAKLPTAPSFQESHFGEVVAGIFLEDILGLSRLYSKLSLNSTQNQNAHKMDLLYYRANTDPIEFIFCEVKSSPKDAGDGLPARHDKSCYPDIFNSIRGYSTADLSFDITTIKDNLSHIDHDEAERIRQALKPYQSKSIGYMGIAVIDSSTYSDSETPVLATRKSDKDFDVDLVQIESFKTVSNNVFKVIMEHLGDKKGSV